MARLELTTEVTIFFAVLILAAVSMFLISSPGLDNITFMAFSQPRPVFDNTVVLSDLNLGETFSQDVPALTGTYLNALKERSIHTNEGLSRYRQTIRLSDRNKGFHGGSITYQEDPDNNVGDFLMFPQDQPLFEWEVVFSPALESRIQGRRLIDLEDERLNILGRDYYISRAEISGDRLELRFFGPSSIEFLDDIDDNSFTEKVEVGGRNVNARVKILATKTNSKIRITSITYQFDGDHRLGGDVLVPPRKGVRQYLREPQGMLNPYFEIIYGGLSGAPEAQPQALPRASSGNTVLIKPSGDDEYRLYFSNTRGQTYVVPLAANVGGSLRLGDDDRALVVKEGSSDSDYNIAQGDIFVVTSDPDIKARTNVLEYDDVDVPGGRLFLVDLSGSSREEQFDPATGRGVLHASGINYQFRVDLTSPNRLVVDQTNDGSYSGDKADFVVNGGIRLRVGSVSSSAIGLDLRTPKRLFDDRNSDEVIDITIITNGNDVDIRVPSQSDLDLEGDLSGLERGMTSFGNLFVLDDDEPGNLAIQIPTGGRYPSPYVRGGQTAGWVIVTLELDRLMSAAAERQG